MRHLRRGSGGTADFLDTENERDAIFSGTRFVESALPVVLSGDIHTNGANDLIADFAGLDSRTVASEFVGTSISFRRRRRGRAEGPRQAARRESVCPFPQRRARLSDVRSHAAALAHG